MIITRGHKIIFLAVVGLIVIITLIFVFFDFSKEPKELAQDGGEIGGPATKKEIQFEMPEITVVDQDKNNIRNQAKIFVERFATYSNQATNDKIAELESMMTTNFYNWASTQYKDRLVNEYHNNGSYASIVTRVLAIEFVNYSVNQSEVIVEVDREQKKVGEDSVNYKQKIRLELIKQGSDWKIDGAFWLE